MDGLIFLLGERIFLWIPLLLSLTVHEYAHALAATWFGDRTAEAQGRLTLDPLAHIDLVGTVLLPILGVPIGWAKPVPVNPAMFSGGGDGRLGMFVTAAAGPASNLGIAVLAGTGARLLWGDAAQVLGQVAVLNVGLAIFNLLPVPPLDGSRIVDWLCPDALRPAWDWVYARSSWGIAVVLIVPLVLGLDLGGWVRWLGEWAAG